MPAGGKQRVRLLVVVVLGLMVWCVGAQADVWYVDADATGANNGTSWTVAYRDLQPAMTAAVSGDEIWVAEGTYKPTVLVVQTDSRTATFQLKSGVALYGGFAGTETVRGQRDWTWHETVLSGDIGTTGDSSDNSYHVVTGSGTDDTAVFDGFTVTAGNADSTNPSGDINYWGGGMVSVLGSPTVSNCTFTENTASAGGGMANIGNGADSIVTRCTFIGNSAILLIGGGMGNFEYASPTVSYCTFDSNTAAAWGGGMGIKYSNPLTVTHCVFVGNSDGLALLDSGNLTLTNCTFTENTGVGMWVATNGTADITYCTVTENTNASGTGYGIYIGKGTVTLGATVVANNKELLGADIQGNITSSGYNLVNDPTDCTGLASTDITGLDPLLGPLADNGGPTLTHALLPNSPAMDAVPCAVFPSIVTDQRGMTRLLGASCDIGAYEAPLLGDINVNGVLDLLDARLCLQIANGVIAGTAAQREAADLDGDGDVDLRDAQILAEYVVGIR